MPLADIGHIAAALIKLSKGQVHRFLSSVEFAYSSTSQFWLSGGEGISKTQIDQPGTTCTLPFRYLGDPRSQIL